MRGIILLVVLSGVFAIAYGQCDSETETITNREGNIRSPVHRKNQTENCTWSFKFRECAILILSVEEINLYYDYLIEGNTWGKKCAQELKIGKYDVPCNQSNTFCHIYHHDINYENMPQERKERHGRLCTPFRAEDTVEVSFTSNGKSYEIYIPRGFNMTYNMEDCLEGSTKQTNALTPQTTKTATTRTIATNRQTPPTTQNKKTMNTRTQPVLTTSQQKNSEGLMTTNRKPTSLPPEDKEWDATDGNKKTKIIISTTIPLVLLLFVIVLGIILWRKRRDSQVIRPLTPGVEDDVEENAENAVYSAVTRAKKTGTKTTMHYVKNTPDSVKENETSHELVDNVLYGTR